MLVQRAESGNVYAKPQSTWGMSGYWSLILNISKWLTELGLGQYSQIFEDEGIDLEVLPEYSESELKELGIKGGHCKKILKAITIVDDRNSDPISSYVGKSLPIVHPAPDLASLLSSLPHVVAVPLQEYLDEDHPSMKLWAACDVVELLLRFFVAVGVADRRRHGDLEVKLLKQLWGKIEMPTLGAWFAMARSIAENNNNKNLIVPEIDVYVMGTLTQLMYGPNSPGTAETSFLALRNRLAHGGGLSRKEAERLMGIWRQPFETAIEALTWLSDVCLIGLDNDTPIELRGPTAQLNILSDINRSLLLGANDGLWLERDGTTLQLWPLALFGYPSTSTLKGRTHTGFENAAQIYVRKDVVSLQFTPLGADGFSQSEAGQTALEAFQSLFDFTKSHKQDSEKRFKVQDFKKEIQKDANQMVGRHEEQEHIENSLKDLEGGVVWLTGPAGIGKSFLIARIAQSLMEKFEGSDTIVLAYRFKAGDDSRCNRDAFANFVIERLIDQGALAEGACVDIKGKAEDWLRFYLDSLSPVKKIVFVLDGLDEVLPRDKTFAEDIPLSLMYAQTTWLCAGRPEPSLQRAFDESKAITPYPGGLPPMCIKDIRGMLLEKIGPLRKKLVQKDKEIGEDIVNPFIELVAKRADGLPLYVRYVVGDVLSGRYTEFHGNVDLPESLQVYHEQLIDGLGIGDLKAVLTHIAATLAVSLEPLADAEIVTFLTLRKLIPDDDRGRELVAKGLAVMAPMLRRAPDPEGQEGFTLFHLSLREHILSTPTMAANVFTAKQAFAAAALEPEKEPSVTQYLYRTGVDHLIDAGMMKQAKHQLLDLNYLVKMINLNVSSYNILRLWANLDDEPDASYHAAVMEGRELGAVVSEASWDLIRIVFCWPSKPSDSLEEDLWQELEDLENDAEASELVDFLQELLDGLPEADPLDPLYNRHKRSGYYIDPALAKITNHDLKKYETLVSCFIECGFINAAFVAQLTICEYFYEKKGFGSIEAITAKVELVEILRQKCRHECASQLYNYCLDALLHALNLDITHPAAINLLSAKYIKHIAALQLSGEFKVHINGEDFQNGSDLIRQVMSFLKLAGDLSHSSFLELRFSLATMLFYESRLDEAEVILAEILRELSLAHGAGSGKRLDAINLLSNLMIEQGRCEDAEIILRDAISSYERVYGPKYPSLMEANVNVIVARGAQGDYKAAKEMLSELMIVSDVMSSKNLCWDRIIYILHNFSDTLLSELGQLQKLLQKNVENHGMVHHATVQSLDNLCEFYFQHGLTESAINLLRKLIDVEEKSDSEVSSMIVDKFLVLSGIFYDRRKSYLTTRMMAELTPRKERILRLFYGLGVSNSHSIRQIAFKLGESEEEIQIKLCECFIDMRRGLIKRSLDNTVG